jgi:hypothetical protein
MRRGAWHQCGDRSQLLSLEQLQTGIGVGVIISPRDITQTNAAAYAERYHAAGADVLIDQQFYLPNFTNSKLDSYGISQFRAPVSALQQLDDQQLIALGNELRTSIQC